MNDPTPDKKNERDSRKEAFFREAQAIIVSQRQWSDETRLKLRILAERLKLPPEVYEAALEELASQPTGERKTRWEEAFVTYLERQFGKYPGDILTLKAERKAINYGQKRFQLSVDACDRLIEQVAERMEIARISETEALRHARNEVTRLATGYYDNDSELVDQVVVAVADWGIDEDRARQLLGLQLAANRRKRRQRRLKKLFVRVSLLVLGLASIAATFILAQLVVSWEEQGSGPGSQTGPTQATVIKGEGELLFLPWMTPESRQAMLQWNEIPEMKSLVSDFSSSSAKVRKAAYEELLNRIWDREVSPGSTGPSIKLDDSPFQSFVLDVFAHEPERVNSLAVVQKLIEFQRLSLRSQRSAPSLNSVLNSLWVGTKLDRVVHRLILRAEENDEQGLTQLLSTVDNELGTAATSLIAAEQLEKRQRDRRLQAAITTMHEFWFDEAENQDFDAAMKLMDNVSRDWKQVLTPQQTLALNCALAGTLPTQNRNWAQIETLVGQVEPRERIPALELLMQGTSKELGQSIRAALITTMGEEENGEMPASDFLTAVKLANLWDLRFPLTRLQQRLRQKYLQDRLDETAPEDWDLRYFSRQSQTNTLALAWLESNGDFENFDQILLMEPNWQVPTISAGNLPDDWIRDVCQAENRQRLSQLLEKLSNRLQQDATLSYPQADQLVSRLALTRDNALLSEWRSVMPVLFREPQFLLRLADEPTANESELLGRITEWSELQLPTTGVTDFALKQMALGKMQERLQQAPGKEWQILTLHASLRSRLLTGTGNSLTAGESMVSPVGALLRASSIEVPRGETLDSRFENILVLQFAFTQMVAQKYQLLEALDRVEGDWRDNPHRLRSLQMNERILGNILRDAIEKVRPEDLP